MVCGTVKPKALVMLPKDSFKEAAILACDSLGIILTECTALLWKSSFSSEDVWNNYQLFQFCQNSIGKQRSDL